MLNTYSFQQIHASLGGPGGLISLGSGSASAEEGITVDPLEETDMMKSGADGSVMHSLNPSKTAKVTVRLLKTSPVNNLLATLFALQRVSALLWGQNILSITDIARGDVYTCQSVAFTKFPSNTYAKEGGMLEWEFNVGIMDPALGAGF